MVITFPTNPELGQEFLADNGVPTAAGTAFYTVVGGFANTETFYSTLDGGNGA